MSVTGQHSDLAPLVERGRASFASRARWNVLEVAFWLAALATVFLLPSKHLILTEIAILALFALSRVGAADSVGMPGRMSHRAECSGDRRAAGASAAGGRGRSETQVPEPGTARA